MKTNTKDLVITAMMCALLCIVGPLSIPIGPVPVSLTTFIVFLNVYILGYKRGTLSVMIYILMGLSGVPVFSGFQGGVAKLLGPTGGYIIGFIPMALAAGVLIEKSRRNRGLSILFASASSWIVYILGTIWLATSLDMSFSSAFAVGVLPFIILDIIKACLSVFAGDIIYRSLYRSGLIIS